MEGQDAPTAAFVVVVMMVMMMMMIDGVKSFGSDGDVVVFITEFPFVIGSESASQHLPSIVTQSS